MTVPSMERTGDGASAVLAGHASRTTPPRMATAPRSWRGARRSPRSAPANTTATAGSRVATMLASLEGSRRRASMYSPYGAIVTTTPP